jgi:serine/threonine protein kinase
VKFLDTCESPTNYYIVQEYCEEGDLKRYLKDKKKLSEREALSILTSILSGYEVLIKNGIVHRDIKPANILISSGGYKLADFGFATSFKNMLDSHVGTPYYMSPQVL